MLCIRLKPKPTIPCSILSIASTMAAPTAAPRRIIAVEVLATLLWVLTTLPVYLLCHIVTHEYPPLHVFLIALVPVLALWESLDLSFQSPLNPAVTLAKTVAGDLPVRSALIMAPAQLTGHVLAIAMVRAALPSHVRPLLAPPTPPVHSSFLQAVAVEAILTATLCVPALSINHVFPKRAAFKKWMVMTLIVLAVLGMNACMNPAMALGLALAHGEWTMHGVYWMGPLTGALVSGLFVNWYFGGGAATAKKGRIRRIKKTSALRGSDKLKAT